VSVCDGAERDGMEMKAMLCGREEWEGGMER